LDGPFEYGNSGTIQTIKLLTWMLHQSAWNHEILYADNFKGYTTLSKTTFMKSLKNERGGPLNVEIHVLFYGENS
jgi:hypothetical protein